MTLRSVAIVGFLAVAVAAVREPAVTGLDHIPIAVRDLARAADDYRARELRAIVRPRVARRRARTVCGWNFSSPVRRPG